MKSFRPLFLVICLLLSLCGLMITWYVGQSPKPHITRGQALIGRDFALLSHKGKLVRSQDFRGKYMLIFFGYTHCPDICPVTLQVLSQALTLLGSDAERIQPLFITVDPQNDTVPVLAEYMKSFNPRFLALTGTDSEIKSIKEAFLVYTKPESSSYDAHTHADKEDDDHQVDHTTTIYLMDQQGKFLKPFFYTTDVKKTTEELIKAIRN